MLKKILTALIVVAVLYAAGMVAGYFIAKGSEPYNAMEQQVKNSSAVTAAIGNVTSIRLSPFMGYSIQYTGASGRASFEATVNGSKGSAILYVKLEKKGVWQVIESRLNGSEIKL